MVLSWGRHYAVVEPSQFRIDYAINPFMDPAVQPDHERALAQWQTLVATLRAAGATVDVIPGRPDSPDMVYAMTLGLAMLRREWQGAARRTVVLSHMRYPQRRNETPSARQWFESHGFATSYV